MVTWSTTDYDHRNKSQGLFILHAQSAGFSINGCSVEPREVKMISIRESLLLLLSRTACHLAGHGMEQIFGGRRTCIVLKAC